MTAVSPFRRGVDAAPASNSSGHRPPACQDVRFGREGNDQNYLGVGWGDAEEGWRWMIGKRSEVIFSHPTDGAPAYVLEMDYSIFVMPPSVPQQRLLVRLGEMVLLRQRLSDVGLTGCVIDRALLTDGPIRLIFEHPDCAPPAVFAGGQDSRLLSVRVARMRLTPVPVGRFALAPRRGQGGVRPADVQRLTGLDPATFIAGFESLGDNCEFGVVQRHCGAEPLSLFRFCYISLIQLIIGLEQGFARLGKPENMRCRLSPGPPPEYIIEDDGYAMIYHTFQNDAGVEPAALLASQPKRQRFLARKLMEDAAQGEKIFIIRRYEPLEEYEVLPLHGLLSRLGPNTLLFVVPAEDESMAGTVEQIIPGLMKGTVSRLAPDEDAHDLATESWLEVCVNAWLLRRQAAGADRAPDLRQTG